MSMEVLTPFQIIAMMQLVSALKTLPQNTLKGNLQEPMLPKVMDDLIKSVALSQDRRRSDHAMLWESIRGLSSLSRLKQPETLLRQAESAATAPTEQAPAPPAPKGVSLTNAEVNEKELKHVMSKAGRSELLWQPYLQKEGRNDYLVIQSENLDPFVTVVPNSIYYNIEKKCVNWLDACSLKGIRAHLLKKVLSPFK